jgi:hypothetical protein
LTSHEAGKADFQVGLAGFNLARKNHAKAEATSSLRARKALRQTLRVCLRACSNLNESKQTVIKLFSLKSSGIRRRFAMARPFPLADAP